MQCQVAKTRMGWSCSPLPLPIASISRINQRPRRMNIRSRTEANPCRATQTAGLHRPVSPSRRSADYHPTIWDHHLIESLRSPYTGEVFDRRLEESKLEVRASLEACEEPVARLRLIDSMRRLGVAYHFEEEIGEALERAHANAFKPSDGIYETALCFRLLRQHGRDVSSDVFSRFRDGKKGFKECLVRDVKGLLSLYEASHLAVNGEQVLDEAKEFSVRHLQPLRGQVGLNLGDQVIRQSLQIPLHWRMPRLEAKHYIDAYQREEGSSLALLELAKLDFNVVQSRHQEELKELSRWWKGLGLCEKLPFSRDRLVENYLWAAGIASEPQFSKCRKGLTKLVCILTVIDDIYDLYGSIEELKIFTMAIARWDFKAMESLSDEFKLCYLALYSFVEEIAGDVQKDHGGDVMPFHKTEWESLCGAYLVEADWFNECYTPSLNKYLENGWISVGGPIAMSHVYFLLGPTLRQNSIDYLQQGPELIYWSSLITRLNDDLGTSKVEMERGDTAKSVQCRMSETGESEEASTGYIKDLVGQSWKELNLASLKTHLPWNFVSMVLNMARTAQCMYQHGDGIGTSTGSTKNIITSLFIQPIPFQ